MSNIPVYTGQWIDWSHGMVLGSYRTFTVKDTLYLVGATGGFLTIVGGSVWSIWAFIAHQILSSKRNLDLVDLQHRTTYRNTTTATSAIVGAFWIYWQWKPWQHYGYQSTSGTKHRVKRIFRYHARKARAHNLCRRTCALMIPAFLIFATFVVVGVLASRIANPAYHSNTVLVRDDGQCGITLFDTSIEANNDFDIDASNRTRAAVAYARTCYSPASGVVDSVTCSLFTQPKLSYSTAVVGCPFGDPKTLFNDTICAFNTNKGAFALQTQRLNSHDHLGINAPPDERIEIYKEMVCSPLVLDGFNEPGSSHGAEKNTTTNYLYGAVHGVSDYTYSYDSVAAHDNVPFAIDTLLHNSSGPVVWEPISNISRSDADVTVIFIAPNSVKYRNQVGDPVFQATYSDTIYSNTGNEFTVYSPDYLVTVIGCTEQYSICHAAQDVCTQLNGQRALLDNINTISLSPAQYVTAIRLIYMVADGNTYSSVDGIGPDSLQIWNTVHDFAASEVPDNQWQAEVRGWLDTTLAKWQAYTVNFAHNTALLGPDGHIGFPISNDTLDSIWRNQCRNQKISNIGSYQNVSVFGFSLIWAVGGAIIILSLFLRIIVTECRSWRGTTQKERSKARRIAWNIDGSLQQQRLALQTSGYYDLIGGEGDVPYLQQPAQDPLPFYATEQANGRVNEFDTAWSRSVVPNEEVQSATYETLDKGRHHKFTNISQPQNPSTQSPLKTQATVSHHAVQPENSRVAQQAPATTPTIYMTSERGPMTTHHFSDQRHDRSWNRVADTTDNDIELPLLWK